MLTFAIMNVTNVNNKTTFLKSHADKAPRELLVRKIKRRRRSRKELLTTSLRFVKWIWINPIFDRTFSLTNRTPASRTNDYWIYVNLNYLSFHSANIRRCEKHVSIDVMQLLVLIFNFKTLNFFTSNFNNRFTL